MAKAGNVSDRGSTAYNKAMCERPCTFGCGGTMCLAVVEPKHRTVWYCNKCHEMQQKIKGDWKPPVVVSAE